MSIQSAVKKNPFGVLIKFNHSTIWKTWQQDICTKTGLSVNQLKKGTYLYLQSVMSGVGYAPSVYPATSLPPFVICFIRPNLIYRISWMIWGRWRPTGHGGLLSRGRSAAQLYWSQQRSGSLPSPSSWLSKTTKFATTVWSYALWPS